MGSKAHVEELALDLRRDSCSIKVGAKEDTVDLHAGNKS